MIRKFNWPVYHTSRSQLRLCTLPYAVDRHWEKRSIRTSFTTREYKQFIPFKGIRNSWCPRVQVHVARVFLTVQHRYCSTRAAVTWATPIKVRSVGQRTDVLMEASLHLVVFWSRQISSELICDNDGWIFLMYGSRIKLASYLHSGSWLRTKLNC